MCTVTRRAFVTTAGAAAWLTVCAGGVHAGGHPPPQLLSCGGATGRTRYIFFDAAEAQFVEAASERLIPADDSGPGAVGADVAAYLDRQLAGPWGAGRHPYRGGSWQAGSPTLASGAARPAAMQFRSTLRAINQRLGIRGVDFVRLPAAAQDALLAALQDGGADFTGIPTATFFATLLMLTVEGFFAHSPHASRRDRIAWPMSGFPGAHAEQFATATYTQAPLSMHPRKDV